MPRSPKGVAGFFLYLAVRLSHPFKAWCCRFFALIRRKRRLAKDFEATIESARAFLYAASVMLLVRRIARAS